ncbi:MAG: serine hydrolase [Paracoccaceae bacterium]
MRNFLKYGVRTLILLLFVVAAVAIWKRDELQRLMTVNSLFDASRIVHNFSHMDEAFLNVTVARGETPVAPLSNGTNNLNTDSYNEWLKSRNITSFLVLHDGQIVHEAYFNDTTPQDLRISWSVAKSYLSALLGIVMDEGAIASLDDPVTKYAPSLKGGAYDAASIRDVLTMTSGVTFDEDYLDYDSDINRMGRVLALGGKMDDFAADLTETHSEPGARWTYVSIDTHVISMVIRGATGRDIPSLLSEKIIEPLGVEQAPYYLTDGVGVAFVLGGLNVTTRDYARFGQMILQDGQWQGKQIVPADWIAESTAPSAPTEPGKTQYGYQWWIPSDARPGEFFARGIYGQHIYFNKPAGVVIVSTAADRNFREKERAAENIALFRSVVDGIQN